MSAFSDLAVRFKINFDCDTIYINGQIPMFVSSAQHYIDHLFGLQGSSVKKNIRSLAVLISSISILNESPFRRPGFWHFNRQEIFPLFLQLDEHRNCPLVEFEALEEVLIVVQDFRTRDFVNRKNQARISKFEWWGWYQELNVYKQDIVAALLLAKARHPEWSMPTFRFVRAIGEDEIEGTAMAGYDHGHLP